MNLFGFEILKDLRDQEKKKGKKKKKKVLALGLIKTKQQFCTKKKNLWVPFWGHLTFFFLLKKMNRNWVKKKILVTFLKK